MLISTSISSSNKGYIVTYRNNTNNDDSDRDSYGDSGDDSNSINKGFNEGYSVKMIYKQDDPGTLVNHKSIIPYTSELRPGNQFVPTSFHVKKLAPGFRPDTATCIEFI